MRLTLSSGIATIELVMLLALSPATRGQPLITRQPVDVSVSLGATISLDVQVTGAADTTLQWHFEQQSLTGATNRHFFHANAAPEHAGQYLVVATDASGSVTSRVAQVEVDRAFRKITTGDIVTDKNGFWNGAWGDLDGDGFIDLFVGGVGGGRDHHLYRNSRDGTFTRITNGPVVTDGRASHHSHGASWADYDNDGRLDLFVTGGNPFAGHADRNKLYHNLGEGGFERIATGLIAVESGMSHGCSWADYDGDGWVDLFVVRHFGKNLLFRNQGDGSFAKITSGPVVTDRELFSESCAWADFDNDGDPDLFVTNTEGAGFLYRNEGQGRFIKTTQGPIVTEHNYALGCAWADYDNDGDLDLFVCNGYADPGKNNSRPNSLFENNGDGSFIKVTQGVLATDFLPGAFAGSCSWLDYDNDGFQDLLVVQSAWDKLVKNALYRNNGDKTFTKIVTGSVANDLGFGVGCPVGDINNDGFTDIFISNGGAYPTPLSNFLYLNSGSSNAWLTVRLVGTRSNRSAIGAKVRVRATYRGESRWQLREVSGGSGQGTFNDLRASFGMGDAKMAELVRVEWPSGTVTELHSVAPRQFLTIIEPPRLNPPIVSDGISKFVLHGGVGFSYALEVSPDLQTWLPIHTNTSEGIKVDFEDIEGAQVPYRFYRARQVEP